MLAPTEARTVGSALHRVCVTPERERALFSASNALRRELVVLVNGRNIAFLGGLAVPLRDGDVVFVFSPLKGG